MVTSGKGVGGSKYMVMKVDLTLGGRHTRQYTDNVSDLYTGNLYNLGNQCHPNKIKFLKNTKGSFLHNSQCHLWETVPTGTTLTCSEVKAPGCVHTPPRCPDPALLGPAGTCEREMHFLCPSQQWEPVPVVALQTVT